VAEKVAAGAAAVARAAVVDSSPPRGMLSCGAKRERESAHEVAVQVLRKDERHGPKTGFSCLSRRAKLRAMATARPRRKQDRSARRRNQYRLADSKSSGKGTHLRRGRRCAARAASARAPARRGRAARSTARLARSGSRRRLARARRADGLAEQRGRAVLGRLALGGRRVALRVLQGKELSLGHRRTCERSRGTHHVDGDDGDGLLPREGQSELEVGDEEERAHEDEDQNGAAADEEPALLGHATLDLAVVAMAVAVRRRRRALALLRAQAPARGRLLLDVRLARRVRVRAVVVAVRRRVLEVRVVGRAGARGTRRGGRVALGDRGVATLSLRVERASRVSLGMRAVREGGDAPGCLKSSCSRARAARGPALRRLAEPPGGSAWPTCARRRRRLARRLEPCASSPARRCLCQCRCRRRASAPCCGATTWRRGGRRGGSGRTSCRREQRVE